MKFYENLKINLISGLYGLSVAIMLNLITMTTTFSYVAFFFLTIYYIFILFVFVFFPHIVSWFVKSRFFLLQKSKIKVLFNFFRQLYLLITHHPIPIVVTFPLSIFSVSCIFLIINLYVSGFSLKSA